MVYTVTINPSLDYIVDVADFKTGVVNRTCGEKINAGGKGINVSIVLKNLGVENTALGFVAGFTGDEIEKRLLQKGVRTDFIHVENGLSRINVKLRSEEETEINGQGPEIKPHYIEELYSKLEKLDSGDILVLAGSIPSSLPETFYSDIMEHLKEKGVKFVVDATGNLLKKSLEYKPFLVKPNNHELGAIFGVELKTREEVVPYAEEFRKMGAENVLVSMAGEGAVLASQDGKIYKLPAPRGKLVNSVGAGDSMVAGFITGFLKTGNYETALKMGLCTGTASACSEELATQERVEEFMKQF